MFAFSLSIKGMKIQIKKIQNTDKIINIKCFNMAKKYKSTKLLKQAIVAQEQKGSAFGKFANKLADSKKKKI